MNQWCLRITFLGACSLISVFSFHPLLAEPPAATTQKTEISPPKDGNMISDTLPDIPGNSSETTVIREMTVPHCKRGPQRCDICRKNTQTQFCLLDLNPPNQGMVQRPVIELSISGKPVFKEYDVVRVFKSADEAREYARLNQIPILPEP